MKYTLVWGRVKKNAIPIFAKKDKITVTSPETENTSKNNTAFTINAASINAKITINTVEIISPVVQAHESFLNVPYANKIKSDEKINHTIVAKRYPKCNGGIRLPKSDH